MSDDHRAAELPSQTAHLTDAHSAENLKQLIPPRAAEFDEPLLGPIMIHPSRQDAGDLVALPQRAVRATLKREQDRKIQCDSIEPADDCLRDVISANDAAAAEQGDGLPSSLLD